jgi:twinkle protein
MKYLKSIDDKVLQYLRDTEGQYLHTKDQWLSGVLAIVRGDDSVTGDCLPWNKTHDYFRFRPGEVTVWAGINEHGKSMISGMAALWLSRHSRVLIASLEMPPENTLIRMTRQAAGCDDVTEEFTTKFLSTDTENLWIYDQRDTVPKERIVGMVHLAAREHGIRHVFIDSLMKCGIGTDDYNGQKSFVDRLCWAAKSENIHIHLIHHIRKGEDEYRMPGKFDARGAGEITDLVDNLLIVFRNKRKEDKIRRGEEVDPEEADSLLSVAKQRNAIGEHDGNPTFKLWFHKKSLQFVSRPDRGPMIYEAG